MANVTWEDGRCSFPSWTVPQTTTGFYTLRSGLLIRPVTTFLQSVTVLTCFSDLPKISSIKVWPLWLNRSLEFSNYKHYLSFFFFFSYHEASTFINYVNSLEIFRYSIGNLFVSYIIISTMFHIIISTMIHILISTMIFRTNIENKNIFKRDEKHVP